MGGVTETLDRKACLDAAAKCVLGQRQEDYGSPEDNFGTIASLWTAYVTANLKGNPAAVHGIRLNATDVAVMLALVKIGRLATSPGHADSWVDLAGYAACGAEIATGGKA